ncbi:MAG: hypothetical protein J6Q42_05055, partial [Clostridia bacterium]|nr:hypothetical protein [Clostridia bacterium]
SEPRFEQADLGSPFVKILANTYSIRCVFALVAPQIRSFQNLRPENEKILSGFCFLTEDRLTPVKGKRAKNTKRYRFQAGSDSSGYPSKTIFKRSNSYEFNRNHHFHKKLL